MLLLRPPGVYPPQEDTWLLSEVLAAELDSVGSSRAGSDGAGPIRTGSSGRIDSDVRVLDICTGTGALAVAAARAGAGSVTAVDVGRRAVLAARANAAIARVSVRVLRGDVTAPVRDERFDVVVSNPPYVVAERRTVPERGMARCYDGGLDGRAVLDRVCTEAPRVLRSGGRLLLVHSGLNDVGRTVDALAERGMDAEVVARSHVPFGPVMRARARLLETRRLITAGQGTEELVVVRAVRTS